MDDLYVLVNIETETAISNVWLTPREASIFNYAYAMNESPLRYFRADSEYVNRH